MQTLGNKIRKQNRLALVTIVLFSFLAVDAACAQSRTKIDSQNTVLKKNGDSKKDLFACKLSTVSGKVLATRLRAISPAGIVTQNRSGETLIVWKNLLRIDFSHTGSHPAEAEILRLTNGDRLVVKVLEASQETLQAEWYRLPGWSPLKIDLTYLSTIFFALPEQIAKRRLLERRLLNDTQKDEFVILRNGDRQRGEFRSLDRSRLTLHSGKVDRSRILGVRFDPRFFEIPRSSPSRLVVFLNNGSKISGTIQASSRKTSIKLKTEWGTLLTIPLVSLKAIEFWNSNKVPLSKLKPQEYRFQPYLSGKWSFSINTNVLGGPLRIRSRESSTGIGMHSRSQITFALHRQYQSFQTWIGIDDDARGKGNVVFAIELDGKSVFRSKPITGRMQAVRVKPIDIGNSKRITLIVEYGDEADIGDYANWFGATLVRKTSQPIPSK